MGIFGKGGGGSGGGGGNSDRPKQPSTGCTSCTYVWSEARGWVPQWNQSCTVHKKPSDLL